MGLTRFLSSLRKTDKFLTCSQSLIISQSREPFDSEPEYSVTDSQQVLAVKNRFLVTSRTFDILKNIFLENINMNGRHTL